MTDGLKDGATDDIVLWRIGVDTPDYEAHDLGGKGAEVFGGRWNRRGTPLVYASASRALACLETVVHLNPAQLPLNRYLIQIRVPQASWKAAASIDAKHFVGWDAQPTGRVSLDWGTAWAGSAGSLLARVPSVIVEEEFNVLINPRHPDAAAVTARKVRRWLYDGRLAG